MTNKSIKSPNIALVLGFSGAIPFISLAFVLVFGIPQSFDNAVLWLRSYGALILSFLGGVTWGQVMHHRTIEVNLEGLNKYFVISVCPALLGWLSILIEPVPGMAVLTISFILIFFTDIKFATDYFVPPWYIRLRKVLTCLVLISLVSSCVFFTYGPIFNSEY